MQVVLDENGYVSSYADIGTLDGGTEVADPEDADSFAEHFEAYTIKDGVLTFDEEKEASIEQSLQIDGIRQQRETECFPIINRGELWYDNLTDEQRSSLAEWYKSWLDAPETLAIPEKPEWLLHYLEGDE